MDFNALIVYSSIRLQLIFGMKYEELQGQGLSQGIGMMQLLLIIQWPFLEVLIITEQDSMIFTCFNSSIDNEQLLI